MFYKRYIYKGKNRNRPVVYKDYDPKKASSLDFDLKKILDILPKPSNFNNEVAFWLDNTATSFAYITIYTLIGDGIRIKIPKSEEALKKVMRFNNRINVNGDMIEDFIINMWIDSLVHGFFIYRVANDIKSMDNEYVEGPDIQRIPPETIRIERDPINGWRSFVQTAPAHNTYSTPNNFLKGNPTISNNTPLEIVIPDDQRVVIYGSFFKKPPMDSVLPFITLKFWILTFIRKYAEKMWAPYMFGFVGDPKTNVYPDNPDVMQEAIDSMSKTLIKLKNFSAAAFPGDSRIDMKELTGKGETYLKFLDVMNREIMFGLFSSIAARESVGVYKANQIADESTVRFMKGIRRKIENVLKRFYVMNVLQGMSITEEDITFVWPELRTSSIENIANSIEKLATYGIFKDASERRRAAAQIFPFLQETDISEEDIKRMDEEFVDLNKPSQPQSEAVKNGKLRSNS